MVKLRVRLVHPAAKLPRRMTKGSAGFYLFAVESVIVPASTWTANGQIEVGRALVPIGIEVELPKGTVGRLASRSGLSVNYNIEAGAGWVDADYRGALRVEMKNFSSKPYRVKVGDRIAQFIILPIVEVGVELVERITKTRRGASGLGSTGH